jgi:alpha-beta hydrolase superfamily lysophospholipase
LVRKKAQVELIDGPAGKLEVAVHPAGEEGVFHGDGYCALICHPHPLHGGTMDNKVVTTLARVYTELGIAAARFNFRGVGASEGEHDQGAGEVDDLLGELAGKVEARNQTSGQGGHIRYGADAGEGVPQSLRQWNRTVVLEPPGPVRGGILLLHGLTDSPYTMRALAQRLRARGLYVVALRLPGAGTVPAAMRSIGREDWLAAVELAASHVVAQIDGAPFYIGGYSNGGTLALTHALRAVAGEAPARPDRVYLWAPAIGVTWLAPAARLFRKSGDEDPHRDGSVLRLRALVLARRGDPGRRVCHSNGRVGDVHVLAPGTRGPVRLDPQILRVEVDLLVLGKERDDVKARERCVPA